MDFRFLMKAQNDKFRAFVFESSLKMTSSSVAQSLKFKKEIFRYTQNDKISYHTELCVAK